MAGQKKIAGKWNNKTDLNSVNKKKFTYAKKYEEELKQKKKEAKEKAIKEYQEEKAKEGYKKTGEYQITKETTDKEKNKIKEILTINPETLEVTGKKITTKTPTDRDWETALKVPRGM